VIARLYLAEGRDADEFAAPPGEPALFAPDSLTWQVFKNPVTLLVGGIAAVVLELAEPRVRTGVWDHTSFRTLPVQRMRRTGLASLTTVYGPRSRAEALIVRVSQRHAQVRGHTPRGDAYRADDPELLAWVQATAAFGFLEAHAAWVAPMTRTQRDGFYAEGRPTALRWGAVGAPASQDALEALFDTMRPQLEASAILDEFLRIVARMPLLPLPLRPLQGLLVGGAVELLPPPLRSRLGLAGRGLRPWQRTLLRRVAQAGDRLLLRASPQVLACRRLGLPEDWLYRGSSPSTGVQ
jgi:uncharacterized protein (DUF2236 family)